MNVNLKITRHKSKEQANGKAPLTIRITKSRKIAYIFLKYSVTEQDWDEEASRVGKNYPNARRLNILLGEKIAEAEKVILDAENKGQDFSAIQLKDLISGGGYSFVSFNKLCREYLKDKRQTNKFNQEISDGARFNSFRKFLKSEGFGICSDKELLNGEKKSSKEKSNNKEVDRDINIHEINGSLLKKYEIHLLANTKSKTTIYNQLNAVRIIYNIALSKDLIDAKNYPFGKSNKQILLKRGESLKIGLDKNEISKLENIEISENNEKIVEALKQGVKYIKNLNSRLADLKHARNVYFFSLYFAGTRVGDTLKTRWSDFKNERFYYIIGKNSKPTSVAIPQQVKSILEYYLSSKRSDDDYVFPDLKKAKLNDPRDTYRKFKTANKKINADLTILSKAADIEKPVSMHIARHTFGNLSKGTLAPEVLQSLYRHSHISTTINYQRNWIKQEQLDEGLLQIVNTI